MPNMEEFRKSLQAKMEVARATSVFKRDAVMAMPEEIPTGTWDRHMWDLRYDHGYYLGLAHGLERALEMAQDVDE